MSEPSLYAAVVRAAGGEVTVLLNGDHPGVADVDYRARRNRIAALALAWSPGQPVPDVPYSDEEHDVWRVIAREMADKHRRLACVAARQGGAALGLPTDRIPQLREVTALLEPLTGFRFLPAAGLVELREFYGALADRSFWSTQYIRHHSAPLFTPEPDVVHEVLGHATTLANEDYCQLYLAAGRAARRVESQEALEFVSKVFWFSLEFGVVLEPDGWKAYGPSLLSSFGELEQFRDVDIRPLDIARMGTTSYDITHYQTVLFGGSSWRQVLDVVGGFFDSADDDAVARLTSSVAVH